MYINLSFNVYKFTNLYTLKEYLLKEKYIY